MPDEINFEIIDVDAAKSMLQEDIVIVDIRARTDYELDRIEGAFHVEAATLDDFLASTPKEKTILCYCYFGNSSQNFCALLKEQGYMHVKSLAGGFNAWSNTS